MKYILTIIGLICLMACSSEETTRTAETESQMRPIAFGDAYTTQPTRSSAAYSAEQGLGAEQSIGVYAYLHDNSTWAADEAYNTANPEAPQRLIPNFMWNQQATCEEKGGNFNYSPLKYWPNETSDKVSFMAYFPYTDPAIVEADPAHPVNPASTASTDLTPLLSNSAKGLPTFNFTVKETEADQVDFLLSELLPNLPNGTDGVSPSEASDRDHLTITDKVKFLFHHMTSKVEFHIVADEKIRKDIVSFHLKTLNVSNLYKNGMLTPTYNDGTTTYAWSEHTAKHGTSPAYTFPLKTLISYLFMPQTLSNDVMLSIDYDVTLKSDGTTYKYDNEGHLVPQQDYTYSNSATIQLNTMKRTGSIEALTEWLPNHHYVYYIRIGAKAIEFTGQVVAWGATVEMNDIEIKEP